MPLRNEHGRLDPALFIEPPDPLDHDRGEKRTAEEAAIREMAGLTPDPIDSLLVDLWREYDRGDSAEARFVRQIDKLETWMQAVDYASRQPELAMMSFRRGAERAVTDPRLRRLLFAAETPPDNQPEASDLQSSD